MNVCVVAAVWAGRSLRGHSGGQRCWIQSLVLCRAELMKNDEEGDTVTSLHLTITSPGHRGSKSLIPLFLYLSPIRRWRGCRSKSLSDVAGWIAWPSAWPSAWPLLMKLMISVFLAFVLLLPLSISIRAPSWCLSGECVQQSGSRMLGC